MTLTSFFLIAAVVEVAVRGIGYDEQLLVLGVGIGPVYEGSKASATKPRSAIFMA